MDNIYHVKKLENIREIKIYNLWKIVISHC